ncbi:MAG: hypothetical protein SF029_26810 [bacterium]|nr:hypothetical protein [bacterium]
MNDQLQAIRDALQAGDKDTARELLTPVLESDPSADAYVLAAFAADSASESITALQQALRLDANHPQAAQLMQQLGGTPAPAVPVQVVPEPPVTVERPSAPARPRQQDVSAASAVEVKRREEGKNVEVEGVYEMLWDCKYCGAQKNLGKTHKFCPNCGAPQDPSWRYYPADDEKVAVADHKFVGADVTCPNCSSTSSGAAEFCGRCGTPLTDVAKVGVQNAREQRDGAFKAEDVVFRMQAAADAEVGRVAPQVAGKTGGGSRRWLYILGGIVLLIVGFILVSMFWTRQENAVVTGFRWEREIRIEALEPVERRIESSCSSAPLSAYNERQTREQVDTRRVPDGETCSNRQVDQGDGTFRQERVCETRYREEAVMGEVCYYTVNEWDYERSVSAEGSRSENPYWPDTRISRANCNSVGCEREQNGGREERYLVQFSAGDNDFECPLPFEQWENVRIEAAFTVEFGVIGGGARCDSLQPASR